MAETRSGQSAHFDASMTGAVVNHVVVTDAGVLREAQRWTSASGSDRRRPFGTDQWDLADRTAHTTSEAVKITERAAKQASSAVRDSADARVTYCLIPEQSH